MSDHNGWSNWETWAIAARLQNDEDLYRDVTRLARMSGDAVALANEIRAYIDEIRDGGSFDAVTPGELVNVDWHEIAEYYRH